MERWNVELNFAAYAVFLIFLMIHTVDGQNPIPLGMARNVENRN